MLEARDEQLGDSPSADAGASLQQPRTDLQQGAGQSVETSTPQTTPPVSQDQLTAPEISVGQTRITNGTTVPAPSSPQTDANTIAPVWLWLAVPLIIVIVLFWPPRKRRVGTATSNGGEDSVAVVSLPKKSTRPAAKKSKKKPVKKRAKRT